MRKLISNLRPWLLALLTPLPFWGVIHLPRYFRDWRAFQEQSGGKLHLKDSYPCLRDRVSTTPFDAHYFYQAAWLARNLADRQPHLHVDIGSDIRMNNVLSAFVPVEFIDYRPLDVNLSGLACSKGDLSALDRDDGSIPSLSCLHVIEHVGLGRYGDSLDPQGSFKALSELSRVLAPGGYLYVSLPVGRERVCFNAHRVFHPATIMSAMPELTLVRFALVDDDSQFHEISTIDLGAAQEYGCGMFVFSKPAA